MAKYRVVNCRWHFDLSMGWKFILEYVWDEASINHNRLHIFYDPICPF